jgi:uncharacterized membrane protein
LKTRLRRWAPHGLAVIFLTSGVLHLIRPEFYLSLLPRGLPAAEGIVAVSGLAELTCGVGLLRRASWAGPASAALLIGIFPANVFFAMDVAADPNAPPLLVGAAWARLPLQIPLIWAALQSGHR